MTRPTKPAPEPRKYLQVKILHNTEACNKFLRKIGTDVQNVKTETNPYNTVLYTITYWCIDK